MKNHEDHLPPAASRMLTPPDFALEFQVAEVCVVVGMAA